LGQASQQFYTPSPSHLTSRALKPQNTNHCLVFAVGAFVIWSGTLSPSVSEFVITITGARCWLPSSKAFSSSHCCNHRIHHDLCWYPYSRRCRCHLSHFPHPRSSHICSREWCHYPYLFLTCRSRICLELFVLIHFIAAVEYNITTGFLLFHVTSARTQCCLGCVTGASIKAVVKAILVYVNINHFTPHLPSTSLGHSSLWHTRPTTWPEAPQQNHSRHYQWMHNLPVAMPDPADPHTRITSTSQHAKQAVAQHCAINPIAAVMEINPMRHSSLWNLQGQNQVCSNKSF